MLRNALSYHHFEKFDIKITKIIIFNNLLIKSNQVNKKSCEIFIENFIDKKVAGFAICNVARGIAVC